MNRNVFLLSCSMALGMSGAPAVTLLGGIIGASFAPYPSWSTLPIATMVVGMAACTVPAALLMKKIGRRPGFMIASFVTGIACLGGIYAINIESFFLLCLVALFVGGNMAFVQQYRFAAAESVYPHEVSKAVSIVLVGGIAAAFIGPELAKQAREMLPFGLYSGSFAALSLIYLVNGCVLGFLTEPEILEDDRAGMERPIREVIMQPIYITAVLAALVSYGVMAFIMTAAPVSMHIIDHFSINETAWVIQSHVMAMFIPSLFTGILISRFGVSRVMLVGITLLTACVAVAFINRHFIHYWVGMVLLGVGWNFLFVGATTLLTKCYQPSERFKAQAVNDFTVFGFQALASLSAGIVIFMAGWEIVNGISLPILVVMFGIILKMKSKIEVL